MWGGGGRKSNVCERIHTFFIFLKSVSSDLTGCKNASERFGKEYPAGARLLRHPGLHCIVEVSHTLWGDTEGRHGFLRRPETTLRFVFMSYE
jgi:hypothetical protein